MDATPLSSATSSEWNELCARSDEAWFWHTTTALDYQLAYQPQLNASQLSFLVTEGQDVLGICPVMVENFSEEDERREFTIGGAPGLPPATSPDLSERKRRVVRDFCFEHVDRLAQEHRVQRMQVRIPPLTPAYLNRRMEDNFLVRHGFLDTSLSSQIIDLDRPPEELLNDFRKGHRNDVRRGSSLLETEVFDSSSITEEIYREYQQLHRRAAGRVTRPQQTWDLMHEWIQKGFGILMSAELNARFIGFSYVNIYKQSAYYASGCNDPDHRELPVAHVLQWETIKWLSDHGFRHYETGVQQFGNQFFDFPTSKDLSISHFKRGFGGRTVPFFRGEKYWSESFVAEVFESRVHRLTRDSGPPTNSYSP